MKILIGILCFVIICFFSTNTIVQAGQSATIKATVTVADPIGFKSNAGIINLSDEPDPTIIQLPAGGSLQCQYELDGIILRHLDFANHKCRLDSLNELPGIIEQIDTDSDTLTITIIYSEN